MGTRGIASPGICVAGARAGSSALSPPQGRAAGACGCLPGWPAPAPGAGSRGAGSCALGPGAAPVPYSPFWGLHDCQVPGGTGRCAGAFYTLYPPAAFSATLPFSELALMLGAEAAPHAKAPAPCCSPWVLGGWHPAPLTQHVPLPGVKPESVPRWASSGNSFASSHCLSPSAAGIN